MKKSQILADLKEKVTKIEIFNKSFAYSYNEKLKNSWARLFLVNN